MDLVYVLPKAWLNCKLLQSKRLFWMESGRKSLKWDLLSSTWVTAIRVSPGRILTTLADMVHFNFSTVLHFPAADRVVLILELVLELDDAQSHPLLQSVCQMLNFQVIFTFWNLLPLHHHQKCLSLFQNKSHGFWAEGLLAVLVTTLTALYLLCPTPTVQLG